MVPRLPLARIIEGGSVGIALWGILFILQLLPGATADTLGVLLFAVVGAAIEVSALRRSLLPILAFGAGVILVVTQTSLSNFIASRWIREDQLPESSIAAVVVLSAGVNPNATINGEALDHLIAGLELIRAGKSNVLVTTTVEQKYPAGVVASTPDQARIVALFGGRIRWLRTALGHSTRDEALATAALLLPMGIRRIAVVTSPMHTPRACAAFEGVGFEVVCVPARIRSPGGADPGPWPTDRLRVFGDWVYEAAAMAKYRAEGWVRTQRR